MRMTIIERAFDLASSGTCESIRDISAALKRESFSSVDAHLQGSQIKSRLNALIAERRAAS